MAKPLLPEKPWDLIQPLIPPHPPGPKGGRPPLDDRKVLTGIIFILKTGLPWEDLPQEMGCACGMTGWNRLRDGRPPASGTRSTRSCWPTSVRPTGSTSSGSSWTRVTSAPWVGVKKPAPAPSIARNWGNKHAIVTDGQGVPLVTDTIPANTPDANLTVPLVDAVPPIAGQPGHPRQRPDHAMGDRGFDDEEQRRSCATGGSTRSWPSGRTPHGSGLGVYRWVVERTLSWFHQFRRLRVRYDRRGDIPQGLSHLAQILITFRFLERYGVT